MKVLENHLLIILEIYKKAKFIELNLLELSKTRMFTGL